ncbi:MAG: hypothetical protein ACTSR3_07880 [Candidatus Helarchaeota archaeon]
MKTSWIKGKIQNASWDEVTITYGQVIVINWIEGGRSRFEKSCRHEEFLEGKMQLDIKQTFGDAVLKEVIENVKLAIQYPPFQKEKEKFLIRKFFLESIPEDRSLIKLEKDKETLSGFHNLERIRDEKVGLKSDSITFFDTNKGSYLKTKDNKEIKVEFKGILGSVVELNDFFYIVHSDNFCVVSPEGDIIFDTYPLKLYPTKPLDFENHLFNFYFSIRNVYRNKNIIFFKYFWDKNYYPPGYVRYEVHRGLVGRSRIE